MDALKLAQELIRLPSVTPDDHDCQQRIGELLAAQGFSIEQMDFGPVKNLWARHGNAAPTLVFAGHTDVVPPGILSLWNTDPFGATLTADGSGVAPPT